jgi:cell wall-associated NlpC family hydrolase
MHVGPRLAVLAAIAVLVPSGAASAAARRVPNWAGPQIRTVLAHGLMGGTAPADFRPNDPLTRQALSDLAFGLGLVLAPPSAPAEPVLAASTAPVDPALATPTPSDAAATVPVATVPATTVPATGDPAASDPAATDPAAPAPAPPDAPPVGPPAVARPDAGVTLAALDARLVSSLGLSGAAAEFSAGAAAAGIAVPGRFGTEVVARLLGLRTNHPAPLDGLELRPGDPATRAEAAFSAAQILGFGWLGNGWQVAAVQSLADSFALPELDAWQRRILTVAFSKIGMPYVWGGTHDGTEAPFGVRARGGYDCSGFVWRVYKLQRYPGGRGLASTLRGRTTYEMSVEVPASERIALEQLQPADVIFFGDHGPGSTSAEIGHMGIYVGDGWFIHSSSYGVALAQLTGWYRQAFAWGRRPLREAGLATA